MSTLIASLRFIAMTAKPHKPKGKEEPMKSPTQFKTTKVLRNIFLSLGAILALVTAAHAQNLYVSAQRPASLGGHAILEFTAPELYTVYASGLDFPRGLAFDRIGNLFLAYSPEVDDIVIGKVVKFNPRNHRSTVGSAAKFQFEGLAIDALGNAYAMGVDINSPTGASTIFKFTPDGNRIVFGSVPGQGFGLAFREGNLYAADAYDQTIYKFAPDGTRTVFVGPSAFTENAAPVGLAFDASGNLFVSTEGDPGNDSILVFDTNGSEGPPFATGLTTPRGLAFDSSGNLFVAEAGVPEIPGGDILKFTGGVQSTFASGFGRPEFLTFGPPR
jgi:hypothetical protein